MADLKPCPFCGGRADMVQPGTRAHSCIVECLNCGCRLESGDEGERSGQSWNRRVPDGVHGLAPAQPSGPGGWCVNCGVTHEGPHPAAGVRAPRVPCKVCNGRGWQSPGTKCGQCDGGYVPAGVNPSSNDQPKGGA